MIYKSRVPWTARRSNESILKEINPEHSLEGLMLKLQYFGDLMRTVDSLEKILMLGKIAGNRRRWWQTMRRLDGITDSMDINLSKLWETVKNREVWHAVVHGVTESDKSWQLNKKISIRKNARNQERDIKYGCLVLSKQGRFHWHVCSIKPLYTRQNSGCP